MVNDAFGDSSFNWAPDETDESGGAKPWKVLLVDDDEDIHAITRLALTQFRFHGRPLAFLHAYSGAQSVEVMRSNPDVAIVFMDVVMETDHAGLEAVAQIRHELGNWDTRIVIRTGQPGVAPEREVVQRYDISDYKEKSELTSQKLFTVVYTSLKLYDQLALLRYQQDELRTLNVSARTLLAERNPRVVAQKIVDDLLGMYTRLPGNQDLGFSGVVVTALASPLPVVLAAQGRYASERTPLLDNARLAKDPAGADGPVWQLTETGLDVRMRTADRVTLIRASGHWQVEHPQADLIESFVANVTLALQQCELADEIDRSQREMMVRLGQAIESRSVETGSHTRRVGEFAALLGTLAGLPDDEADVLRTAAPLHDAGKIGIPDAILHKPGRLTEEEWEVMKTHTTVGEKLLEGSSRSFLQAAAVIAAQHHERWDGQGYPRGLAGKDIHIYGRISAVADVFDALASPRVYKDAWPMERITELFAAERGRHFDPHLVDLLLENLSRFNEIRRQYPD